MPVTIPYKPAKLLMLVLCVAFGGCAFLLVHIAREETTTLSLFHLVPLNLQQSIIAFWILASLSMLLSLGACIMVFYSLFSRREIVFHDDSFQFPHKGWNNKYHTIPYSSVNATQEVSVNSTRIYYVYFDNSKIALASSMVPEKHFYEQFKSELEVRCAH